MIWWITYLHHHLRHQWCLTWTEKLRPKHHLLIHLPSVIAKSGPLIGMSCMRYELKNYFFKRSAHTVCNFTNICFTLAKRHQQRALCSVLSQSHIRDSYCINIVFLHSTVWQLTYWGHWWSFCCQQIECCIYSILPRSQLDCRFSSLKGMSRFGGYRVICQFWWCCMVLCCLASGHPLHCFEQTCNGISCKLIRLPYRVF